MEHHQVKVGNKLIGRDQKTFIIAEIGNNHNGDMQLARDSIKAAAESGADAVKFQKRHLDQVFIKDALNAPQTKNTELGTTYGEYRQKLELDEAQLKELREYAQSLGLAFFATPFDLKSMELLSRINMDAWKIASFDITHVPLLEAVAQQGKPVFLSTGMASLEEIDDAVRHMSQYTNEIILFHCVSVYPTPDEDLNLGAITTLLERYPQLTIGYSGHELGYIPTIAAVAMGARAIERHFTLDKSLPGPDHATVSLDVAEFTAMVKEIRRIEQAASDRNIYIHEKEFATRNKHSKSVVALRDIKAGEVIAKEDLTCKSPGTGIKPGDIGLVIGKKAKEDILADTTIQLEQLDA